MHGFQKNRLSAEDIEQMIAANFSPVQADDEFDPESVEDGQGEPSAEDETPEPSSEEEIPEGGNEEEPSSDDEIPEGDTDPVSEDEGEGEYDEADAAFFSELEPGDELLAGVSLDEDELFLNTMATASDDFIGALVQAGEIVVFKPMFSHEDADIEAAMEEAILAGAFDDEEPSSEDAEGEIPEGGNEDEEFEPSSDDEVPPVDDEDEIPTPISDEDEDEQALLPAPEENEEEDEVDAELKRILAEADEDVEPVSEEPSSDDEIPADDNTNEEGNEELVSEEPTSEDEESTAMFTPVISMEEIEASAAEEVVLDHFEDAAGASHWNVTVAGRPAACIASASVHPNTLSYFNTQDFARQTVKAMQSEGVLSVLKGMGAEFYATAYMQSEMAEEVRDAVTASANSKLTERMAELHDSLLENATIAATGFDKNFWPKAANPLKAALYEQFVAAGVYEQTVVPAIEAAFAEGSNAYFQAVLAKAVELLNMPQAARDVIAERLAESGVMAPTAAPAVVEEQEAAPVTASFASRLVNGDTAGFVGASATVESGLSASISRHLGRFAQ